MRKNVLVLLAVCAMLILACGVCLSEEGKPDDTKAGVSKKEAGKVIADAKTAFAKLVKAIKANKKDDAKKYFSKQALDNLVKANQLDTALGMLAKMNLKEFTPKVVDANHIVFVKEYEDKNKTSVTITVNMVKEDGQWKVALE